MKYTINDLEQDFPNDDVCLDYIFKKKFPELMGDYYRVSDRKSYVNQAGLQIYPLANTIFHKSSTPLTIWFRAIFLFSCSENRISAKELEKQLGVTYKTAWRMTKQILSSQGCNYEDTRT